MAEDLDALGFLGDLALQDVLSSVGIGHDGLDNIGLAAGGQANKKLARADIFKDDDNYEDDEDDDELDLPDDDREDDDDDAGQKSAIAPPAGLTSAADKYYQAGLAALSRASGPSSSSNPLSLPTFSKRPPAADNYSPSASPDSNPSPYRPPVALPQLPQVKTEPFDSGSSVPPASTPDQHLPPSSTRRKRSKLTPPPLPERTIQTVFPGFKEDGILDFVGLFAGGGVGSERLDDRRAGGGGKRRPKGKRRTVKLGSVDLPPPIDQDDMDQDAPPVGHLQAFLPPGTDRGQEGDWEDVPMLSDDDDEGDAKRAGLGEQELRDERGLQMVNLGQWEDDLLLDGSNPPPPKRKRPNVLTPYNAVVDSGEWVKGIVWDSSRTAVGPAVGGGGATLETVDEEGEENMPVQPGAPPRKPGKEELDPYNISNDHHYEGMKHRVRQTFGSIIVQHSYPALKLQLPFYKTSLNKHELRAWHRPPLQIPTNIRLSFDVVQPARKLKDKVGRKLGKGGDVQEGLRKVGDLTLRDKSDYVLWEFSEEHPPVMSGFGMGSVLVNYYRKKTDDDDYIPKLELGEPFVLDPKDEPPYSSFAPVDKGQTQQTLYNNLIKAPLFKHKPASTDFLVVKVTVNGSSRFYIREMKNLFVVGQTIPSVQVPGPHARKVSATAKDRTHQIAYRLLQKAKGNHMKLSRLMKYFPDCHELQMRQRLKDFLEFHRKGIHQQTWRLKVGLKFPEPSEYLKMVDPESVMMIESMAVGRQHLQDSGYGTSEKDEKNEDESKMDSEQKLAPWIMTKTYLHSQRDKAWVQLYGEGDPTGRGEGFSFIKVSMKDAFLREGETAEDRKAYIATLPKSQQKQGHTVQEQIFRLEARRIWDAQYAALSSSVPPELTEEEEFPERRSRHGTRTAEDDGGGWTPSSPGYSAFSSGNTPRPRSPGGMSRASSLDRDDTMSMGSARPAGKGESSRVLKIKRLVNGKWKTEIVRDANIINAYVRKRQIIEEKSMAADAVAPTGDADKDRRAAKFVREELEKLKKNQARRLNRKKALEDADSKPVTSRKCANCGAVGHMKTNRKCPRWAEFNLTQKAAPDTGPMGLGMAASGAVDHLPSGFFSANAPAEDPPSIAPPPPPSSTPAAPKLKLSLGKKT